MLILFQIFRLYASATLFECFLFKCLCVCLFIKMVDYCLLLLLSVMASTTEVESLRITNDESETILPSLNESQQNVETKDTNSQKDKADENKKKRRLNASEVWEHFTKIGDGKRASCNYYSHSNTSDPKKNGTSTMKGNMLNCTKGPFYSEVEKDKKILAFYKKQKHGEEEVSSTELLAMH